MSAQRFRIACGIAAISKAGRASALRLGFAQFAFFAALLLAVRVEAAVLYVNVGNTTPAAPYTNWLSAATTIQEAIDSASAGDTVFVTNGMYAVGGRKGSSALFTTNRVAVTKAITVQSVNGPWATVIRGGGMTNGGAAIRCVWLTNGAALIGFTLEGGATLTGTGVNGSGGGVFCNASNVTVANCIIRSNTAADSGAAAYQGSLRNCYIADNLAPSFSGVVAFGNLYNCTVVRNSGIGVGLDSVNALNSIIYFNPGLGTISGSFSYCCTTPPKPAGLGNITNDPVFLSDGLHLNTNSPCRGAGTNAAVGVDIDGRAWSVPPPIGCADWEPKPVIGGPPKFQFNTARRQLVFGLPIEGEPPFFCSWTRDGVAITNDPVHSDAATLNLKVDSSFPGICGSYQVVVSNASGVATSPAVQILVRYVDAGSTSPVAPYTNWATAAAMIQDAVDAALPGEIVLVTNGTYASGGKPYNGGVTNRVLVMQPRVTIASVNGYASTIIEGAKDITNSYGLGLRAVRCCFLATNGVSLSGFTLRGGATAYGSSSPLQNSIGGGIASLGLPYSSQIPYSSNLTDARVVNCLISSNAAYHGGAAVYLSLVNCVLAGNASVFEGGGTYNCYLTNCTVSGNSTGFRGGGTSNGNLYNCISYHNTCPVPDPARFNSWFPYVVLYTCTTPAPSASLNTQPPYTGDIVADPQFVDSALNLAAVSPARGTGSSLYSSGWDMEGRTWHNPPSMGAREVDDADFVGALAVTIATPQTNSFIGRAWNFTGQVTGHASGLAWDWGDGTISTNVSFVTSHVWTNAGDYTLTFTAFNSDNPGGVSTNLQIRVLPLIPPLIELPTVTSNGFACQFVGQSNANYTLQQTTNLVPPVTWRSIQTVTAGAGLVQFTNVSGTNLMEFYRVWVR